MTLRSETLKKILALVVSLALVLSAAGAEPVYAASRPAKTTGVKVVEKTSSDITVQWKSAKRAKKYQVGYKLYGGKWKYTTVKDATTNKTVAGLKSYRKYCFKVRGLNGSAKGKWSSVISAYTEPTTFEWPALPTISDIRIDKSGYGSLLVGWDVKKAADTVFMEVPVENEQIEPNSIESEESTIEQPAESEIAENSSGPESESAVDQSGSENSYELSETAETEYQTVEVSVPVNNDKCVFNLYVSEDGTNWSLIAAELSNKTRQYLCRKCEPGKTYYFKVVALDNTTYKTFTNFGDESSVVSGTAHLPEGLVIKGNFITRNGAFKEAKLLTVKGLMVHSVGEPIQSAQTWVDRFNKPDYDRAAVHAFVDGTSGVVNWTMPWDMVSWHAGKPANQQYIGVEMCESKYIKYTSGTKFKVLDEEKAVESARTTYENTVKLFAYLCDYYGIDPNGTYKIRNSKNKTVSVNRIISHNGWRLKGFAGHYDPEHYWSGLGLPYTMSGFRKDVTAMLKSM